MTPPIMGITHARVVLYSIDMARMEVCDLIVDTGSTLSWVPEEVAARVGIQATEVRTFRLADGREVDPGARALRRTDAFLTFATS